MIQPWLKNEKVELSNFTKWSNFKIKDIFIKPKIKKFSSTPEENKGEVKFVTSKSSDQGVDDWIDTKHFITNVITVSTNGNCFDCFYHERKIAISSDVEVLTNDYLNKFNAHFITSILKLEQKKWNYGRKPKNNAIMETVIKLPADQNGKPDWNFMERYVKSLPYSKYI